MSFKSRSTPAEKLEKTKEALSSVGKKTRHDIPLNKSKDTQFLTLLIALMSILLTLSFSGAIALSQLTNNWSSGLENKLTIEIPVETQDGNILSAERIEKEKNKIQNALKNHKFVQSIQIMSQEEIETLLSPWLNENLSLADIPLPGLIALELKSTADEAVIKQLENDIKTLSPYAYLETHEEWLADIISFIKAIEGISLLLTVLVTAITLIAIISGIRTRMIVHKKEIELLHYMGATDHYIASQFQRHTLLLTLKGAVTGTAIGLVIIFISAWNLSAINSDLLPSAAIDAITIMKLISIPLVLSALSMIVTRVTLLNSLSKIP